MINNDYKGCMFTKIEQWYLSCFFFFKLNLEFLLFFKTSTNVEKEKNEEEGKKI